MDDTDLDGLNVTATDDDGCVDITIRQDGKGVLTMGRALAIALGRELIRVGIQGAATQSRARTATADTRSEEA